jgi:PAS domain S-box-containing protein
MRAIFSNRRLLKFTIILIVCNLIITGFSLVNGPYYHMIKIALPISILLLLLCVFLFAKISNPIINGIISEEHYRSLFENNHVCMLVIHPFTQKIMDANPAACLFYGYDKKTLVSMKISEINALPPDELKQAIKKAQSTEQNHFYFKHKLSDGTLRDVEVTSGRIRFKGEELLYSIVYDITERIQFELKLNESEEKFKQLVWDMQVGVLLQGPQAEILLSNPKALELLGISEDQLLGKTSFDPDWNVIHEDGSPYPGPTHPVPQAIVNRRPVQDAVMGVYRPITDDRVWLLVDATPQLNTDGTVKQVVCTFINITERIQAQKALRESDKRYALTLDAVNDGFWDWNVQSGNAFFSPHYFSLLEYDNEEFPATYASWRLLVNPEDLVQVEEELQKSIENGYGFAIDLRMKLKSGKWRWFSTRGRVVEWGKDQKALRMVGTLSDITGRKQAELQLQERNEEIEKAKKHAEESDYLKTAFLQNMSHEIRTPMNAIMGFSDLLAEQYNNKPKLEEFSRIIHQRSADLLDLINEILDIAKIESGQLPVHPEECDLNSLFAELSLFFIENQKRLNKQHIELNIQSCDFPLVIITDKVKLKQIFINLIGNAFKFTENGKIEAGYRLDRNNKLLFFVSDTGIGIPADKQNYVFERFTQLNHETKRTIGGTGLGLSIVKGLVTLLGGEIWLESESGKGTAFYFTISYSIAEIQKQEPIKIQPDEYNFPGKTILIVEDDIYNAAYLKEILMNAGFKIMHTFYGREAIELSLSAPIDMVLMDINLPDMNGYEATRQIKQRRPGLKIIAQTAYAAPEDKQKAFDAGCNDYISKPLKRNLLLAMLGKQLNSAITT